MEVEADQIRKYGGKQATRWHHFLDKLIESPSLEYREGWPWYLHKPGCNGNCTDYRGEFTVCNGMEGRTKAIKIEICLRALFDTRTLYDERLNHLRKLIIPEGSPSKEESRPKVLPFPTRGQRGINNERARK